MIKERLLNILLGLGIATPVAYFLLNHLNSLSPVSSSSATPTPIYQQADCGLALDQQGLCANIDGKLYPVSILSPTDIIVPDVGSVRSGIPFDAGQQMPNIPSMQNKLVLPITYIDPATNQSVTRYINLGRDETTGQFFWKPLTADLTFEELHLKYAELERLGVKSPWEVGSQIVNMSDLAKMDKPFYGAVVYINMVNGAPIIYVLIPEDNLKGQQEQLRIFPNGLALAQDFQEATYGGLSRGELSPLPTLSPQPTLSPDPTTIGYYLALDLDDSGGVQIYDTRRLRDIFLESIIADLHGFPQAYREQGDSFKPKVLKVIP